MPELVLYGIRLLAKQFEVDQSAYEDEGVAGTVVLPALRAGVREG